MISTMGDVTACFSNNYQQARRRFLDHCQGRFEFESIPYDAYQVGAKAAFDTCDLAMDLAWLGDRAAQDLLIVSSGLHGLEGRLGSACQLAAMAHGNLHEFAVQHGWSVLMMHGMNPFGFAYDRRWDADGVDPNRNFLLPGESFAGVHPVYRSLDPLLNPDQPPTWRDRWMFYLQAVQAIRKHGFNDVKQAIAEGQYEFSDGLFFGGRAPGWTQRVLQDRLSKWIAGYDRIIHVDIHSGLGRWDDCQLLMDYVCRPWQQEWMAKRFPNDAWEAVQPSGIAYNARGGLGRWCDDRFADQNYLYLCAEVGTYGPMRVLRALRLENQAWRHLDQRPAGILREAREMFCPRSPRWRNKAVSAVWGSLCRVVAGS